MLGLVARHQRVPYKQVSFAEITDGSSNTILLAEKSAWGQNYQMTGGGDVVGRSRSFCTE